MPGIRCLFVIGLGLTLSLSPCLADDDAAVEPISAPLASLYSATIFAESNEFDALSNLGSSEHFRLANDFGPGLAPLEFRQPDTIGRMFELRSLSLITLAETGNSRLFFGVSSDGYLGIHLRFSGDRQIEFSRMPWVQRGPRTTR